MARQRIATLCGILAPILWGSSIVYCGSIRPGYSHVTQYISELGERGSSTELLMRYAGFVPTGLMHVVFAAFLFAAFGRSRLASVAAILLGVNGLARMGAGVFPCEAGCAGAAVTLGARMHSLSAGTGFLALIASVALWSCVFKRSGMRNLAVYSVLSAAAGLVFLLLMVWSAEPGTARGLFERLSSGALSLWILVFAVRLWRNTIALPSRPGDEP